jgi:hypothetical protein
VYVHLTLTLHLDLPALSTASAERASHYDLRLARRFAAQGDGAARRVPQLRSPISGCPAQALEKLLPAEAAEGRRLARSDSHGRVVATDPAASSASAQPVSPTRASAVPLAALTYLIEAADEHRAQWGWCR